MHMYILALCTDTPVANWFVFLLFFLFFFSSSHLLLVFSFFYYVICYFSYLLGLCHNYKTMRCCVITHTPRKPQRPQNFFFFLYFLEILIIRNTFYVCNCKSSTLGNGNKKHSLELQNILFSKQFTFNYEYLLKIWLVFKNFKLANRQRERGRDFISVANYFIRLCCFS